VPWKELTIAVLTAACGQILIKLGAPSPFTLAGLFDVKLLAGLGLYGISALAWVAALGKQDLGRLYPFTAATFVLVMLGSALILHETWGLRQCIGATLVLAGLYVITAG